MQIIFFSSNIDMIDELTKKHDIEAYLSCYDLETLSDELKKDEDSLVFIDFDSVASDFNKLLSSNNIPKNSIVLERVPEIATGKMLVSHGVKAYGNIRMQTVHYLQMLQTVMDNKVWTYPQLTSALIQDLKVPHVNEDATVLIQNRLSPKEIEVVYYVLEGLTNDAISVKLEITTRTVKAHVSSIFSKLHVNDRIALVLLLK